MKTRKLLLILGLAGFVVMADNWVISPILPSISQDLGVSAATIIIAAYMLPLVCFSLFSDTWPIDVEKDRS